MYLFNRQIRGIIAISILLAMIPFIIFISDSKINYEIPPLADQSSGKIAVEIAEDGQSKGIYFVFPKTSVNQLLKSINHQQSADKDFLLESGTKININTAVEKRRITVDQLESTKRIALGMPLDINRATEVDLLLVSGIGEITAKKILDLRAELGRYKNIEQLTQIKGIKEKKLAKFRQYLYVPN